MRTNTSICGAFVCNDDDSVETETTAASYLTQLMALMAQGYTEAQAQTIIAGAGEFSQPFTGKDYDAATLWLYPGLTGMVKPITTVRA